MGSVAELFRYPLKSARGEAVSAIDVDADGLHADRGWACVDLVDGTLGSLKQPRRWGRLLDVCAWVDRGDRYDAGDADDADDPDDAGVRVMVAVGREQARAGSPEADALLSDLLERPVRLTQVVPQRPRVHRLLPDVAGMVPEWMADAAPGEALVTEVAGARPGGRFVDFGAVHVVTTGALAGLSRQVGREQVEVSRFRPNVVLDAARDPEPGEELQLGDAVLRVSLPTPRCIVPGLGAGPEAPVDRDLLRTLARHHRTSVGALGRAACFGVYAEVLHPGQLEIGQLVRRLA